MNQNTPSKRCYFCKKIFFKKVNLSKTKWDLSRYCSLQCRYKGQHEIVPWNKGIKIDKSMFPNYGHLKKHTKETIEKLKIINKENAKKHPKSFYQWTQKLAIQSGLKNNSYKKRSIRSGKQIYAWLGENASYSSKHKWIQKHWQKTGICENCKKEVAPFGRRKYGTEWHNLNKKYNRDKREDWMELCPKCHHIFDKK